MKTRVRRHLSALCTASALSFWLAGCPGGTDGSNSNGGGPADNSPPTVPTGLGATAASTSRIDLSWAASTDDVGVAGYRVYRGTTEAASPSATSWSDTGRAASTQYCYTVAAYDSAGKLSGRSNPACATTPDPPPAFPGFDLALTQGTFWSFGWDYYSLTGSQSSGGNTTETWQGHLRVRLGTPTTIAGRQAFPVEFYGPTWIKESYARTTIAPRWRWLAGSGSTLLGSTDGVTLKTVYDLAAGYWSGGGFFASFPATTLITASTGVLANDFVNTTGVVSQRSSSQSQCEYIAGILICGDSSYSYTEKDYYEAGLGPLGYFYERSYNDCGGGYCSWGTWREHVGAVASSFMGDGFTPLSEVEPNDSRASAQISSSAVVVGNVLASDLGTSMTLSVPTATLLKIHDFIAFDHTGGAVEVTLSFEAATGADLDLLVFDGAGALLGYSVADNVASGDLHEQISGTLATGRYYAGVSGYTTPARVSYQLQWE